MGRVEEKRGRISRARLSEKHKKELAVGSVPAVGRQPDRSRHATPGCVKHKKERIPRARLSAKHKKEAA